MHLFDPLRPFNDLPPLPPAVEIETRRVLKKCIEARAAVAELRQAAGALPNPSILLEMIPLLEAQASSAIENIVTTTDRLFQYAQDEAAADPATQEALRYRRALYAGYLSLADRPLSTRTALEICGLIKNRDMAVRRLPGTALRNDATQTTVYTPPDGEARLLELLSNWEGFLHDDAGDLDPLIRLAIMHYQFEAIHPFTDGNGRTGRILNILFLVEQRLLDLPILFLSRHIIRRKEEYYERLQAVTVAAAWEDWILYMLDAIHQTAAWTTGKIAAIRAQLRQATEHVETHAPALAIHSLIDLIFRRPYCRISDVVDTGLAKRQTASTYLHGLQKIGVLESFKVGRDLIFLHPALLTLLRADDNAVLPYALLVRD